MEDILMWIWARNGRKWFEAFASAKARNSFGAVMPQIRTEGAAHSGHLYRLAPCKPDGLLLINPENLISECSRVKIPSIDESTA